MIDCFDQEKAASFKKQVAKLGDCQQTLIWNFIPQGSKLRLDTLTASSVPIPMFSSRPQVLTDEPWIQYVQEHDARKSAKLDKENESKEVAKATVDEELCLRVALQLHKVPSPPKLRGGILREADLRNLCHAICRANKLTFGEELCCDGRPKKEDLRNLAFRLTSDYVIRTPNQHTIPSQVIEASFSDSTNVDVGTQVSFCSGFFDEYPGKCFTAYVEEVTETDVVMYCAEDGTQITSTIRNFDIDVEKGRIKIQNFDHESWAESGI